MAIETNPYQELIDKDNERRRLHALKELFNQVEGPGAPTARSVPGGQFDYSNRQMTGSLVSPYFSAQAPRKKYMNRYLLPQNYLK
mgnify:FL=1